MNWFKGEIAEAVVKSKNQNAVFVVYIEGTDENSTRITELINTDEVSLILGSDRFVAIQIQADSVPHQQFSQIYKQVPVPSIYFIGKQGVPLEIVTDVQDSKSFALTLNRILEKAGLTPVAPQPSPASPPADVTCENGECRLEAASSSAPSTSTESTLTAEEKVERAKELLEKQREAKRREEEENERQKEMERRKMGRNVQQMQRWQDDQELKQLMEQRKKEKQEGQAAKQRVLDQIAQDKADRAARFTPNTAQPEVPQQYVSPKSSSATARIQFRLPDGRTFTHDFSSKDTLEAVHSHIRANLELTFTQYTLSTTFPRREFTDLDQNDSLQDLGLVPTAVILILPLNRAGTVSTNSGTGLNGIFWSLLAPLVLLFTYLKSFIFGSAPKPDGSSKRSAEGSSERAQPKVRRGGETTVIRRHGNIHRLSDKNDSDDENNTWNGNSTQQM